MDLTITVGWWLLPLVFTLVWLGMVQRWAASEMTVGDYAGIGNATVGIVALAVWAIPSLIAWLIYALFT